MNDLINDPIAELARRVEEDPFFLASALREYARSEGMDERALAAVLGCPVETLPRLALCRRPRPEPPHFGEDVDRIARRFEVDAGVLADIARHADALAALRRPASRDAGLLMAARDREGPHPRPLSNVVGEGREGREYLAGPEEAGEARETTEGAPRGEGSADPNQGGPSQSPDEDLR